MSERTPNLTKTVAWFLEKKALIKFADDEKSYKLAENVIKANNFEKFPIRKADIVEVGILNDAITFLRKAKSQTPKDEGKGSEEAYEPTAEEQKPKTVDPNPVASVPSTNPQVVGEVKELTIFAVSANKKVIKFTELKDAGWFQIDPSIQAQDYAVIGLQAKNKVKVAFNDKTVISLAKVASEPAESPKTGTSSPDNVKSEPTPVKAENQASSPKREWKPTSQYNDDRQTSIECQAMINSACDVVGRVAASISPAPTANIINNMIRSIAESNYQLLQELKKK